jgi:hypothetical protein
MSDEPENRITRAPGRDGGPRVRLPQEEAGDPLDAVFMPPSRFGAWFVGLAALLAAFHEWTRNTPERAAAAFYLVAAAISFGFLSAGARKG